MNDAKIEHIACDLVVFVATSSEFEQLKRAATELGLPFTAKDGHLGRYYDLGAVGSDRVITVRTDMGSHGFRGSASQSIFYLIETQATAIVGLGMAFGIAPSRQHLGDVLVSSGLLAYDYRIIRSSKYLRKPIVDYSEVLYIPAKESLVAKLTRASLLPDWHGRVHIGLMLSGCARIHCRRYRDEIANECGAGRNDNIVGGEMEGIGLASGSDPFSPNWVLVKGVSDFADKDNNNTFPTQRMEACYNSARFFLAALQNQGVRNV